MQLRLWRFRSGTGRVISLPFARASGFFVRGQARDIRRIERAGAVRRHAEQRPRGRLPANYSVALRGDMMTGRVLDARASFSTLIDSIGRADPALMTRRLVDRHAVQDSGLAIAWSEWPEHIDRVERASSHYRRSLELFSGRGGCGARISPGSMRTARSRRRPTRTARRKGCSGHHGSGVWTDSVSAFGLTLLIHPLGPDKDDAVRAAHAVDRCIGRVLQDADGFDIVRIDARQGSARTG